MPATWRFECEIDTCLQVVRGEDLHTTVPLHPSLTDLRLEPAYADGKPNGLLSLSGSLNAESNEEAFDSARDAVNRVLDFAAVLSAGRARVVGQMRITRDLEAPGTHQSLVGGTFANLHGPVPLISGKLFQQAIRPELRRAMSWYRRGVSEEQDVVASLASLFTALDLLGNEFEGGEPVIRKCKHCKKETRLAPSTTEKNRNLLINVALLDPADVKRAIKSRQNVVHGGIDLTVADLRDLRWVRDLLTVGLTRGLKRALGIGQMEPPPECFPDIAIGDSFLILEHGDPADAQSP